MKYIGTRFVSQAKQFFDSRFRGGLSTRQALVLSVCLHVAAAAVAGSIAWSSGALQPAADPTITFELVTPDLDPKPIDPVQNNADAPRNLGKALGDPRSTSRTLVAEQARVNKQAVVMASLAQLSQLRESFRFVVQQVAADSLGTFRPLEGKVPSTEMFTSGADGYGFGSRTGIITIGAGSGHCPPGGGGILK